MIKLFAAAGLMAAISYIGIAADNFYKKRCQALYDFSDFLLFAEREISMLKTDIISIIDAFNAERKTLIFKLLEGAKENCKSGLPVTADTPYFSGDERMIFSRFFASIVKSGYKEQSELFTRYKAAVNDKIKLACKQKKEKGELIKKLCILGGVGLMIVIV